MSGAGCPPHFSSQPWICREMKKLLHQQRHRHQLMLHVSVRFSVLHPAPRRLLPSLMTTFTVPLLQCVVVISALDSTYRSRFSHFPCSGSRVHGRLLASVVPWSVQAPTSWSTVGTHKFQLCASRVVHPGYSPQIGHATFQGHPAHIVCSLWGQQFKVVNVCDLCSQRWKCPRLGY